MPSPVMQTRGAGISFQDPEQASRFGFDGCDMQTELLPAALRRRTSVATRVAFAAAERACRDADADPAGLATVFTSSLGEINVTDRLCSDIAHERYPLSPTQFHNSVHNTASGYWSIAVGSAQPAMAMAGYQDSFALGLLESWCQLQSGVKEILLVCYEEKPVQMLLPDNQWIGCAIAFVLSGTGEGNRGRASIGMPFTLRNEKGMQDYGFASPAMAAMELYKAVEKGDSGRIAISPDGESIWYSELNVS